MNRQIGTKVFWVSTGGFDTHANQNPINGAYTTLMTTVNNGLASFYNDLRNQGMQPVLMGDFPTGDGLRTTTTRRGRPYLVK